MRFMPISNLNPRKRHEGKYWHVPGICGNVTIDWESIMGGESDRKYETPFCQYFYEFFFFNRFYTLP